MTDSAMSSANKHVAKCLWWFPNITCFWHLLTGVCDLNDLIYCIGGWNGQAGIKQCDVLNPETGEWSSIASLQTGESYSDICFLRHCAAPDHPIVSQILTWLGAILQQVFLPQYMPKAIQRSSMKCKSVDEIRSCKLKMLVRCVALKTSQ